MSDAITPQFRALLGRLTAFVVESFKGSENGIPEIDFEKDIEGIFEEGGDSKPVYKQDREVADLDEANVVSSLIKATATNGGFGPFGRRHIVAIDLDIPAYLIPSSSPGHSHFYAEVWADEKDYFDFLKAAAKIGLIEDGYAEASIRRGHSDLRLPWVVKGQEPFTKTPVLHEDERPF